MTGGPSPEIRPDQDDDAFNALLSAAQDGRPEGFDGLVRMMSRRLVAFARSRGVVDPEATANEVLVQMCQSIGSFSGNRVQFRAWVYTIARHRIIDEHRRSARRVETEPLPSADFEALATVDADLGNLDQRERIDNLLRTLTDEQREVILLRVLGGLSVEETGMVVGRRPGAVRALQHRATRRLRSTLSAEIAVGP